MAEVGSVPQAVPAARLSTLRFFDGNVHRIAALALAEATLAFLALHAFVAIFAPPATFGGFGPASGAVWPHALPVTAIVVACMSSMGFPHQLRQRSGRNGMLARASSWRWRRRRRHRGALPSAVPARGRPRGRDRDVGRLPRWLLLLRLAFARVVDLVRPSAACFVWGAGDRAATIG
ncbi:MAG: hypothetical protein IPJ28_11035 [Betaproteobacteria bacterium]|nr:hypothetical protein [Betaproteobacteria bacterium]